MAHPRLLLSACAVLLALSAQAADVWRYKDANGIWQFTDRPVPGAEKVTSLPRAAARHDAATATTEPSPAIAAAAAAKDSAAAKKSAQQVKADVSAVRADHCKKATENYEQSVASARIYKPDAQGNPQYLDADQIDAYRIAARTEMQQLCAK
jgi:hypothetical protein